MIIKKVETEQEVKMMSEMSASSDAQNQMIINMYEKEELELNNCYIMLDHNKVVARVILLEDHFGLYTLEDIALRDAEKFVQFVLEKTNLKEINMHLYSDKINHSLVLNSLLNSGFMIVQEKESYSIKPKPYKIKKGYSYRTGKSLKKDVFLEMIKKAFKDHKDRVIVHDSKLYGKEYVSEQLYNESESNLDYCLAIYYENVRVGFVLLKQLTLDVAGIGYIGVLPQYRGNRHSNEILKLACSIAHQEGYKELVADIDVENYALRDNLVMAGYKLSCTETVLIYKNVRKAHSFKGGMDSTKKNIKSVCI